MSRRRSMSRRSSKQLFSRTASRSHRLNFLPNPMRGGFRI